MAAKEITDEKEKTRHLQFYQEIMDVSSAFKSERKKDVKLDDEIVNQRLQEGKPLIDREKIEINERLLDELLHRLLPILKKYNAFPDPEIHDLEGKKDKIGPEKLVRSILVGDSEKPKSVAQEFSLNSDLLLFLGLNLSQALLKSYAQRLKDKIDRESWLKGYCPLCGSYPAMEKLRREDGKRILWCGLCGTQWHFKRIMCPFCDNEDHNSLKYFFTEGGSSLEVNPFRVDVCDECKKYIKTIDERKMPDDEIPDFYIENMKTLYLDLLAQKDGYQSPTYWMITSSEMQPV